MILQFSLPDAIHASRIEGHRLHLEAHPENWSLGEWISASGVLAAVITWCWKKPIKKLRNMIQAPDRIEGIDKKLDMILSAVSLAVSLSRNTWRAIDRPLWQADSEGKTIHVNTYMLKILCRQESDLLGNGWINSIHEADRERVADEWSDAVRNKTNFFLHYRLVSASGESIPVIGEAFRLTDTSGNVLGFMGYISLVDK